MRPLVTRFTRGFVSMFAFVLAFGSIRAGGMADPVAIGLPTCEGVPQVRPSTVMLACGDGGVLAKNLTWTGWGGAFAAARGTAVINVCTPDCAAGHYRTSPIVLIADGRQRCSGGRIAYAKLTAAWYAMPRDAQTNSPLEFPMPCTSR